MATKLDIQNALERNDADEAERLMADVQRKHLGRGLSGHDQDIFRHQIARIRATAPAVELAPAPEPEPEPEKPRSRSRRVKVDQKTGDIKDA